MRTDRLLKLADHLEAVVALAPETFDMEVWHADLECGTASCAMGHACLLPEFQAAGLGLGTYSQIPQLYADEYAYGLADGYGAAELFFGLSAGDARYLFDPIAYPDPPHITPNEVAARIRVLTARETAAQS